MREQELLEYIKNRKYYCIFCSNLQKQVAKCGLIAIEEYKDMVCGGIEDMKFKLTDLQKEKAMVGRLKFRAWDTRRKRMVLERFYINCDGIPYRSVDPYGIDMSGKDRVYPYDDWILMQSTGFIDRNGNDVYDGDIISLSQLDEYIWDDAAVITEVPVGEVFWDLSGLWNVKCIKKGKVDIVDEDHRLLDLYPNGSCHIGIDRYDGIYVGSWGESCEVIGNIYENPELKEKE